MLLRDEVVKNLTKEKKRLSDQPALKTTFLGLDNSGKTSIIRLLEEKLDYNTPLRPTSRIDVSTQHISLLGVLVKHWDFGGQKSFRKTYLKESQKVFAGSKLVLFIIDIQDQDRYQEALNYLEEIYNAIKLAHEDPHVFVLFHKYDPYLDNRHFYVKKSEELEDRVKEILPTKKLSFHKTSIYNKMSIIKTFSYISQFYSEIPQKIQEIIKDYCADTFSEGAILFDKRNYVLDFSDKAKSHTNKVLELIAGIYIDAIERLEGYSLETLEILSTLQFIDSAEDDRINIYFQRIELKQNLYLVSISANPKTKYLAYDKMKEFTEKLMQILQV